MKGPAVGQTGLRASLGDGSPSERLAAQTVPLWRPNRLTVNRFLIGASCHEVTAPNQETTVTYFLSTGLMTGGFLRSSLCRQSVRPVTERK